MPHNDKKSLGVKTQRKEYQELLPFVQRNRRAVAGERKVKAAGVLDLPPTTAMCCSISNENGLQTITYLNGLSAEGRIAYEKYKSLASWFGATAETLAGLVGLIKSKDAIVQFNSKVDYIVEDVDGKGTSLREMAGDIYADSFITPWSGVLADFPGEQSGLSIQEAEASGKLPRIQFYNFESIWNWADDRSFFTLVEEITVRDGFDIQVENQYRVLELIDGIYNQTLYNDKEEIIEGPSVVLVNGSPSTEIPFFWNDSGENGGSVLDQLIDMNYHHYRVSADYGGKLYYSSFAIFTETGAAQNNTNVQIGNGVKWNNISDTAQFGVVQADGNADGLRTSQLDDQERMAALGADALRPRSSGVESAEAKSLDKVAQNSKTADVAITVGSDVISPAVNFCSRWLGGAEGNVYSPNTDYVPTGMSAQDLTALVASWQSGAISKQTLHENLQRGEIASTERTFEEEEILINSEEAQMNDGFTNTTIS